MRFYTIDYRERKRGSPIVRGRERYADRCQAELYAALQNHYLPGVWFWVEEVTDTGEDLKGEESEPGTETEAGRIAAPTP